MVVTNLAVAVASLLVGRVAAQTASVTAVCTYAEWTFYKSQSPCQVWGSLQAACDPHASVGKLDTSTNVDATYPPPQGASATACQCNVIAYNLMAGCSWCQPDVYTINWVTESVWKSGCSSYDSSGALPPQASSLRSSIPPWALLVENGQSWDEFDASSIALAGTTPTGTFFPAPTGFGTGTATRFGSAPTFTGPFSGGDDGDDFDPEDTSRAIAKVIGIAVGIVLGFYLILYGVVLGVFFTRQKNRKAWYGPTAEFYRNGGHMGDLHTAQPLLGGAAQSPNPFVTPSPSAGNPTLPQSPFPPTSPQPSQHSTNVSYGQGYPAAQYQQPTTGHYDPNANYSAGYPQYYNPNTPHAGAPHAASTQYSPEL